MTSPPQSSGPRLLWTPSTVDIRNANLTQYMTWLHREKGLEFFHYADLWQWSVEESEQFWNSLFDYFELSYSGSRFPFMGQREMPGAEWFPEMRLNYAENIFARSQGTQPMMVYKDERSALKELSWEEVYAQTNRLAQLLLEYGVAPGERVVAYLPNIPEAMIACLATTAIGGVWSSCAPDFGSRSVLDRFTQIEPKILIAVDGYQYGGKTYDRNPVLQDLQAALPSLERILLIPHSDGRGEGLQRVALWEDALAQVAPPREIPFKRLPFDHPLWVLYSSGTTGLPKPIVHGHGGILLEHVKATVFHNDLRAGDRFFWYSSTGWMMWNYMLGSLLSGASVILYNGSPAYPDLNALFELTEESGMTYFGTSAAFIGACIKAGITPNQQFNLSRIRGVGSTGSPLTSDGFDWVYANINGRLALESLSGGTDLCTAFVGGARILPIYAGEIQGASLGAKVQAYNQRGEPVINQVGELVIAKPMPSMPLYFWNDPDMTRYTESYFELYPGQWRHGDWIEFNQRGGCVIYGRSDSTINRQGIRMGTSEIYQAVEGLDEVLDSLIVDLELLGRESYMPLFVKLRPEVELTNGLVTRIKQKLRTEVSPRHVPNEIIPVEGIPYTLSGKKMEVPIRKILLGMDVGDAANPGAMRNPEVLQFFLDFADRLAS